MTNFQRLSITVSDVVFGGKALARVDGKVVFSRYLLSGERAEVEITREHAHYAEARLLRVLEASPLRTKAPCPYFGSCGGCSYQHAEYGEQLRLKAAQVRNVLRRLGGMPEAPVEDMRASPQQYGYRNRIAVHTQDGITGFFQQDSNQLIAIDRCLLANEAVNDVLQAYKEKRPWDGRKTLAEPGLARGFQQTNPGAAAILLELVREMLLPGGELLVDAYCGSGFFMRGVAEMFERTTGIDWSRAAMAEAEKSPVTTETLLEGAVEDLLPAVLEESKGLSASVILDPPAEGLGKTVVRALLATLPQRLVYVSCDPSTFARDVQRLAKGYRVQRVVPVDMFPQTAEIELVALLARVE